MLPFIRIFGRAVPLYGILNVAGAALGILTAVYLVRQRHFPKRDVFFAALYAVIGVITGGKLLFLVTILPLLLSGRIEPAQLYLLLQGGFVFYGALIGAAAGVCLYCRKYKLKTLRMLDTLLPGVVLAHAVGRVGCFFAGCCYGIEYRGPLAVILNDVSRFPVQPLESVLLLIISAVLVLFSRKDLPAGKLTGLYLVFYTVLRFFLEFLRGDSARGSLIFLSTSQWISLLLLPAGLALLRRKFTDFSK